MGSKNIFGWTSHSVRVMDVERESWVPGIRLDRNNIPGIRYTIGEGVGYLVFK